VRAGINHLAASPTSWRGSVASLRFDDAGLERRFRRSVDAAAVPLVRVGTGLGIALTIAFGFVDVWLVGDEPIPTLVVHGLVAAILAGCLYAQRRPWWLSVQRFAGPAAVVVAAFVFDLLALVSPMPQGFAALTTMVAIVFLCTLIRTTLGAAVCGSVVMVVAYVAGAAANGGELRSIAYYLPFTIALLAASLTGCYLFERGRRREFLAGLELARERARSEALLRNVLPQEIADQLRGNPDAIAVAVDEVSVVFADIVGFTPLSASVTPTELVALLDELFSGFDSLCDEHGVEKIKTIGDAYMAVAGVPSPCADHAGAAAELALGMLDLTRNFEGWPGELTLRVGMSSGPAVAGVIGRRKFAYDLWGETVNTASRMQSHGVPGSVQISEATYRLLEGRYVFGPPRQTMLKGKGMVTTYHLRSRLVAARR